MRTMPGTGAGSSPGCSGRMGIDLWDQALTFAGAAILGMGAGLVYDLMLVLRRRLRLPLLGPVLDFLFWLLLTAALFVYAVATGGRLRIFMVIAVGLGAVFYFLLLSRPALFLAGLLADGIAYLCHLAALPMIWLGLLCKKLIKIAKNIFHYGRRWYKIRLIPG